MPGHPGARRCAGALLVALLALAAPPCARAQALRDEAVTGGEAERYLRLLQVTGRAPLYPWAIRGFSPAEVDRLVPADSAHPWAARLSPDLRQGVRAALLRPQVGLTFNSAAPVEQNDGAVWAGRGLTAAVSAGVAARTGALSLRLEPMAFWSQNREFELMELTQTGPTPFADPDRPRSIDRPQRFGDDAYARVDPGQSTLRLDVRGVAVGLSTANQQWGPAADLPLVLGTNAGGFPHLFVGTANPWKVGIGRLHLRVMWADLEQSAYSSVTGHGSRRYGSGVVATFLPWGMDGLEVGFARFFHEAWPQGGLEPGDLLDPLQAFLKADLDETGQGSDQHWSPDNQIASAFARWVFPRSGVEVWGEYVRNDHNWDLTDFILEPDHSSGYLLGVRKGWMRGGRLMSASAEWLDTQPTHLLQIRRQGTLYGHGTQRQGHTHRGQILGSPAAFGGGGAVLALEGYTPGGRWRVDLARTRVRGGRASDPPLATDSLVDVVYALGGEAVLFRRGFDLRAGLRGSYELNRHLRDDSANLTATLGARVGF